MQNNPHSRREREIFPAFLGKVCEKTSQSAPAPDSPEGGAFRHLPVSRAKPPPFGGGGFAKQRRRGFSPLAPSRAFPAAPPLPQEAGAADDYPFRHRLRRCHLPQGDGFSDGGKLCDSTQRLPLGGASALAPEGVTSPVKRQFWKIRRFSRIAK